MAQPNISSAAAQAGLTSGQQNQVDGLIKLLDSHKNLLALPASQAQTKFAALPQPQQNAHVAMFGEADATVQKQTGWLGTASHYMSEGVKQTIGRTFSALNEVSDFMTRLYRTGAIALDQQVNIGEAFSIANDKGDNVFSPNRIANAKKKYGADTIDVAIKVAEGQKLADIIANGTDAQKAIASAAVQGNDPLFQDALDSVQAAKYSPGRAVANLLLPGNLEGSGFLYKGISGIVDAGYRVFADPTLALGKAKKAYDAGDFLLYKLMGKADYTYGRNLMSAAGNPSQVDRIFSNPRVVNLFNEYGSQLERLDKARKANGGAGNAIAAAEASTALRRIAPEFGPVGIDTFIEAGVKDAATARNYLQNHADISAILKGQAARGTPLIPKLDASRKARILFFTATDKVFNIDKVGQKIVQALYGTAPAYEDIITGLGQNVENIAALESKAGKFTRGKLRDGSIRLSLNQINGKIDRFARQFTAVPYFSQSFFDVNAVDAVTQVYRVARLGNTRYHSRIIAEAFAAGNEGQRKQIFTGLWNTVAEIRGASKASAGRSYMDEFAGKGRIKQYAATIKKKNPLGVEEDFNPAVFDGQQMAIHANQLSSHMAVPSITDLDRLSARAGIIGRVMGLSHKRWADKLTSVWVIGTLAGPKFPVRNAGEDMMLHLAVGDSPWGIVKGRMLSTKLRTIKEAELSLSRDQIKLGNEIKSLRGEISKLKVGDPTITAKRAEVAVKQQSLKEVSGKKVKFVDSQLGFINKLIKRNEVAEFRVKLAEAGSDVEAVRKVTAEAILRSRLSKKIDPQGSAILSDIAQYGHLDDTLGGVAEGGMNALRGGDYHLAAANDAEQFGQMQAITIDSKRYKLDHGNNSYVDMNPLTSESSRITWLMRIGMSSSDDLDKIIIKNLDNTPGAKDRAIAELKDYLDSLTPKQRERFSLYSTGATTQVHAERVYDDVQNIFSKADGSTNMNLVNKIRSIDAKTGEIKVSTKALSLDDLPGKFDYAMAPNTISGPTLVPVTEGGHFAAGLIDKAWDYMGVANARFSREPLVLDAMIQIRKDMIATGFDKRIMSQLTAGLTGKELLAAEKAGKRHLVSIAEDLAKDRILGFVDNPAVRSQLAMSSRNFARFYRATEDFYRRIYRTVKYNPEALTRASLTYEGIAHSGFVQTDDNGDQYFFYPGLAPVYKVMDGVAKLFGVKEAMQVPMPIEFGGKTKMVTPSLNPDSIFPTFAGPISAASVKAIVAIVPQLKSLESALLGTYGEDQPIINSVLPSHVTRLLAGLSRDERSSQYASAYRKSATYLEASGHGIKLKIDPVTGLEIPASPKDIAAYQDKLQASTLTVLAMRFLFGFVAPASPQITLKSDMAKWVRDNGATNYKQVFNQLLTKYNDIDKATQEWIKYYPDQMPFTISESEKNVVANVRAVEQSGTWIEQNGKLLAQYPEGASFLIPQQGDFDFNSYKLLFNMGIKKSKTLTDFLREVQTAKDKQEYYNYKNAFEAQLATTFSVDAKRQLRSQWQLWSDQFKGARPLLQEELGQGANSKINKLKAYADLTRMLNDKSVTTQPKTRAVLKQMVAEYDAYIQARDAIVSNSDTASNYKDLLKNNTIVKLKQLGSTNANAQSAYNVLFSTLIGE